MGGGLAEEVKKRRCILVILRTGLLITRVFLIAHGWKEQACEQYISLYFGRS